MYSILLSVIPRLQTFPRLYDATEPRAGSGQKTKSQESQRRLLIQIKHMGTYPALHHTLHPSLSKNHDPGKCEAAEL